jgi:hypothetical protein
MELGKFGNMKVNDINRDYRTVSKKPPQSSVQLP